MDRLQELLADGVIDEVYNQLKSGKEAEVWLVSHRGEPVAAKIYKAREFRSFKNDAGYKEGRQVRNTRTQRAMNKGSKFGREAAEEAWKSAEADAMFELHAAGVKVPKPVLFYEGVLLMEVIGDAEGRVAPRLVDAGITPEQAGPMYLFLRGEIIKILAADWIHGDLSEFNILLGKDGPVIIDFPQVVTAAKNSRFSAIDPALAKHATDADEIWRAYVRRDLSPHFVPSGRVFSGPPQRGGPPRNDRRGPPGAPQQQQGGRPQNARADQRGAPQQPRNDAGPRVEHRGLPQAGSGFRSEQRNPRETVGFAAPAQQHPQRGPAGQHPRRDEQRSRDALGSPSSTQQQQTPRNGGTPGEQPSQRNREPRVEQRGAPQQQQQPSNGGDQPAQNPRNREPRVEHRGAPQPPQLPRNGGDQPSQNPRNREPRVEHRGSPQQQQQPRNGGDQPSQNPRNRDPRAPQQPQTPRPPRRGPDVVFRGPSSAGGAPSGGGEPRRGGGAGRRRPPRRF
jgi:RIO kinase 1